MKKVFFVLLLSFIISGCSVKYELNIDENYIHSENINVSGNNEELGLLSTDKWIDFYLKKNPEYSKNNNDVNSTNYNVGVFSSQGNYEVYNSSAAVSKLFLLTITNVNGERTYYYKYNIKYDQDSFENNFDKLEVVLDSKIRLTGSNANKYENGKYYWTFDDKISDIYFSYKIPVKEDNKVEEFMDKHNIKSSFIYIIIVLFFLLIIIYYVIKAKKHNKI